MLVKAGKGRGGYLGIMIPAIFRVLALVSLILMPFGMANATASAAEHQGAAAAMPCGGDEQPSKAAPENKSHCPCCVALAEPQPVAPAAGTQPSALIGDRGPGLLLGLEREVATPPPKHI